MLDICDFVGAMLCDFFLFNIIAVVVFWISVKGSITDSPSVGVTVYYRSRRNTVLR
jgi:hypothetical protein